MKEVMETVSEVQFRSIAVIVAGALLGMLATWWVLTGPASPSLTAVEPKYGAGSLPEVQAETETQAFSPQPAGFREQPEILVEKGNAAAIAPHTSPESSRLQEPEAAESEFAVQIGAFLHEEGATRQLAKLEEQGYDARLVSHEEGGTVIFRLVAGDFDTREEAAAAAKELKSSGIDAFVREFGAGPP
jgi:cell division protein FtsN